MAKIELNYEQMVAAAEKQAGSSDWGPDDPHSPLKILLKSFNEEADSDEQGRLRAKSFINSFMVARLQIVDAHKKWPEIAQQKIDRPIFCTGSQRSGTSYLNAVLAADPKNLGLFEWQLRYPTPPANHPRFDHEPQKQAATKLIESEGFLEPYLRNIHDYDPMVAAEDTFAQCYSFISVTFPFFFYVPAYGQYIQSADNTPAYKIEKMLLQVLQYGTTGRQWMLKSPMHISMLRELFSVFPDARFVVNHRDPTRTLSSLSSLLIAQRRQFGSNVTVDRQFALALMEGAASGYEDMMKRRQDPKVNAQFVDVNYVDLERDALSQATRVYQHFGLELDQSSEKAMAKYIAENRKGKHGKHRHKLEDSGLRVEEVRERFKTYLEAYDVPRESG